MFAEIENDLINTDKVKYVKFKTITKGPKVSINNEPDIYPDFLSNKDDTDLGKSPLLDKYYVMSIMFITGDNVEYETRDVETFLKWKETLVKATLQSHYIQGRLDTSIRGSVHNINSEEQIL